MDKDKLFSELLNYVKSGNYRKFEPILTREMVHMNDKLGTLLQYAADKGRRKIVELLIKFQADLNVRKGFGRTPVMLAIESQHIEVLKVLLQAGADILLKKDRHGGSNAIEIAMDQSANDTQAIELLYRKLLDDNSNNEKLAKTLIAAECNMFHAAAFGNIQLLEFMLKQGIDISSKGARQRTAIHAASALNNSIMASWLVDHGAEVNAKDKSGESALTICAERGHKDVLETLLKLGADPNSEDYGDKRTPLFAVFDNVINSEDHQEKLADCARLLLMYGAIPRNSVDDDMTMIDYGLYYRMHESIKIVISHVAMVRVLKNDVDDDIISCRDLNHEESATALKKYHEDCLEVLKRNFFQNLSLIHFLKIDDKQFEKVMHKKPFKTDMKNNADIMYEECYSYYHALLMKRINKAMYIIECEDKAAKILGFFFNGNMSHEFDLAVNIIIGYLNLHDIETLINMKY